jgi:phosphoribosylformylglycinamidine synthase
VGVIGDYDKQMTLAFKAAGETIWLIGAEGGHLGQSLWLRETLGREDGPPPPVDLAAERRAGDFIADLIASGRVTAVHDLSDGGLAVALTEMALAGRIGATITEVLDAAAAFGEGQGRYLLTMPAGAHLGNSAVRAVQLGTTGGDALSLNGKAVPLASLRTANEDALAGALKGEL